MSTLSRAFRKYILAPALLTLCLSAFADGQSAISADSTTNLTATYTAGTAQQQQNADTAAAQTAGSISAQDQQQDQQLYGIWQGELAQAAAFTAQAQQASQASASATDPTVAQQDAAQAQTDSAQAQYWTGKAQQDDTAYQAWLAAVNGAQAVSNQQSALAAEQGALAQQAQQSQQSSDAALLNTDVPQAQSDTANQAASSGNPESQQSLASVQQQTGVQQGQVQPSVASETSNIAYIGAATAGQASMAAMARSNQTANIQATQDAQNASSCGNPWCAAAWWAANAVEQQTANGLYTAQMAAAPALATTYITASKQAAQSSYDTVQGQIGQMTGVQQQTTALPTSVNQTPYAVTNDTSYQAVGSGQNAQQVSDAQTNTHATWQAAQDWSNGLQAQTQEQAAQTIQNQDLSAASQSTDPYAQQAWQGAAGIAGQQSSSDGGLYAQDQSALAYDTATQNSSATAVQNDTTEQAQAMNNAASRSALSSFDATLQSINAAVASK